ncbi:MAG: hypothetical protein NZM25_08565 [Leptospiraceae bacterium]|nr:hypothetical protein [Leptospiraceae bacterium]MDW8306769.1 hypothetical protein [Leptospiraceae bacterium]
MGILERFYEITGRRYHLYEYFGHPEAEDVVVLMGSAADCAEETVDYLVSKEKAKVGIVKVRLFRPFLADVFLSALPPTVKQLCILDRTKEKGSAAEPLYSEIAAAMMLNYAAGKIKEILPIYSGRYGLGSKEFNPAMVRAIFENMKSATKKVRFTVGIVDVSDTAL